MITTQCELCGTRNYQSNLNETIYRKMLKANYENNLNCACGRWRAIRKQHIILTR